MRSYVTLLLVILLLPLARASAEDASIDELLNQSERLSANHDHLDGSLDKTGLLIEGGKRRRIS